MRYLLLILLLVPSMLCGQLKKAEKLVKKEKLEEALQIYDELRNSPDSIEKAAAQFGYLKSYLRLHPAEEDLMPALELHQETVSFFQALSREKRRTLSKTWRVSLRGVEAQEKLIRNRAARILARSDVNTFFIKTELLDHPGWSDASQEHLGKALHDREAELMTDELTLVSREGLKAFRQWLPAQKRGTWSEKSLNAMRSLREQLVRQVVNNDQATYEELQEVYNHHFQTEAARNPRFTSLITERLFTLFKEEFGFEKLYQFIEENPLHWIAQDCYANELAELLRRGEWFKLPDFLLEYPNTVLDNIVLSYLATNMEALRQHAEVNKETLDLLSNELSLRHRILMLRDTSLATYQELVTYLARTVPAPRSYSLFRRTAQLYLKQQQWARLDALVAEGKRLFTYGQPEDCSVEWVVYANKQKWLKEVEEILRREGFATRSLPVVPASIPLMDEYSPVISADNQALYFARYRGKATTYDVVVSRRDSAGNWMVAEPIGTLASPTAHEVPLSLTAAGNEMLLFLDGRLARSFRTSAGWSLPQLLTGSIAARDWHGSATLSPDGEYLILETNYRPGEQATLTDTDLYLAKRVGPGAFDLVSTLTNLNSRWRDTSPYLSNDGRTLYFSSDGRSGLGGTDVYISRREGDGWMSWSTPENFGKSVNSFYDDNDFKLGTAAGGKIGYYGINDSQDILSGDIYAAELPEALRPQPFRIVKLPVTWSDSLSEAQRSNVTVTVRTDDGTKITGSAIVDDQVVLLLPEALENAEVTLTNKQDSERVILPLLLPVDLKSGSLLAPVTVNARDNLRKGGELIRLAQPYNVDQDDFEPTAAAAYQLTEVYKLLQKTGALVIIHAYADATGSPDYNKNLCQRRAEAVREYFLNAGLSADRVQLQAHGSTGFIATNDTEAGRSSNRRVELEVE